MMPITTTFTITALMAVAVNALFLVRAFRRKALIIRAEELDVEVAMVASSLIRIWITILAADLLMLAAGIGILTGHRELGYLLAVAPLASTIIGLFALKDL